MENKIIHGDCIEELRELKDNSIDLVCIDPPYFVPSSLYGAKLRLKGKKQFKRNFGDLGVMEFFFKEVFKEITRVLKPTGRMYVFCNGQSYALFYYHLFPFCKSVRPLIWDKICSVNGYSWRHQHEIIIFAEMPEAKPIPTGDGDIIKERAVKNNLKEHIAEKPVELLKRLISKSSEEGDIVLDCFAGSGSTMRACKELNRKYVMIEKELDYYKLMEAQINS